MIKSLLNKKILRPIKPFSGLIAAYDCAEFKGDYQFVISDAAIKETNRDHKFDYRSKNFILGILLYLLIADLIAVCVIYFGVVLNAFFINALLCLALGLLIAAAYHLFVSGRTQALFCIDLEHRIITFNGTIVELASILALVEVSARNENSAKIRKDDKIPPNYSAKNFLFILCLSENGYVCHRLFEGLSPNTFPEFRKRVSDLCNTQHIFIDTLPTGYLLKTSLQW